MRSIVFTVPGKVQGKGRPRFSPDGHAYTPASTRLYEREILKAFRLAGGTKLSGPLHVDIEAVYGIQKTATKAERMRRLNGDELALKKPDIDNVTKVVLDALNGYICNIYNNHRYMSLYSFPNPMNVCHQESTLR